MRTPTAVLFSSLALLAACGTQEPRPGYYITPVEMLDVYGTYPLSNGDVLRVSREHRRYWAEMNRTGRFEILPVASIVFVQKGGPIRLSFDPEAFTTKVTVDGLGAPATLASARGQSGR